MRYDIKTEDDVLDALDDLVEEIEELVNLTGDLNQIGFDLFILPITEGWLKEDYDDAFKRAQDKFDEVNTKIRKVAKEIIAIRTALIMALKGNSLLKKKLDPNNPDFDEEIDYEVEDYTDTVNKQANIANAEISGYKGTFITIADAGREVDNAIDEYNSVIDAMNEGLSPPPYKKAKLVHLEDTAKAVVQDNINAEMARKRKRDS